jgi:hypothetical protein
MAVNEGQVSARPRRWRSLAEPLAGTIALAVRQAQARLRAELAILTDDPLAWLKSGPGKELLNLPGWTSPAKPLVQNNTQFNVLLAPELQTLMTAILRVLAPYPEARQAVAAALSEAGEEARAKKPRQLPT